MNKKNKLLLKEFKEQFGNTFKVNEVNNEKVE